MQIYYSILGQNCCLSSLGTVLPTYLRPYQKIE